ncbi:MAG: FAD-dependent oxidoreductase [Proteobacteria bacterium]|nr:CoB--CoM heterodisulfide reductase iron-sulfur subunit A family protein [Desulfobacteraceae bacterium]MBU3980418.1 FAD-dependent oxidoreductase [Pseudomonadota bacterium]MBU4013235.1 FAD-dependent oxidoreductase [Pseudomonadota bacterium]MBU4067870.1 FAD-dependent oxidoreductase [Pseudomonadota bacterium]MBU4101483.1 FAD-dependent oxidoreductase [Pseudomonadota bacterium]
MFSKVGSVLVIGGGIAGIQASLDLADSGYFVYLIEKASFIGGKTAQLDKTYPLNDCSFCIRSDKHMECISHTNIKILTLSEVKDIKGSSGDFEATIIQHPRYVDIDKCTNCGLCAERCPEEVNDEFNEGLGKRKVIYLEFPEAAPNSYVIDRKNCLHFTEAGCNICKEACMEKAIDFDQKEQNISLNVGSIIFAAGFDSIIPPYYDYDKLPNVITSMEFERIHSLNGPYGGHLVRPSDRKEPSNIAWLQCIGSRDIYHNYCSSVCCMYAIKQAILARRSNKMLNATIFFMDMRVCGKDHERYYNHAKNEDNIRFVRSKVHNVFPVSGTDDLLIRYADEQGNIYEEIFNMVVLSLGLEPSHDAVRLAGNLGITLDKNNFVETSSFTPVNTSIPGIYVCGAFNAPKDISESITEASAAACASSLNAVSKVALPEPFEVTEQKPVPAGLIIGGGVTGMVSGLCLADQGYKVYLVEKTNKLGGHALKLRKTFKGEDVKSYIKELIDKVENHPLIDVCLNSEVKHTDGYAGNFSTRIAISSSTETKNIKHGVTIISTGADFLRTSEYLYGKNSRVLIWFHTDKILSEEPNTIEKANTWVFILCVGSREPERPYCSKICCSSALRNAMELKKLNPDMEIYVLYRDMRTYGLIEDLYTEARDKGIVFIRYKLDGKPEVEEDQDGKLMVRVKDNLLGEDLIIQPDFVTLQTAIVPGNNENLAKLFKLPVDQDGFLKEAHKKFKPVEFTAKGIYFAGLVHSPKPIDEAISQAQAAAAKAVTVLSREYISTNTEVASIDLKLCVACLTCARICPAGALIINGMGKPYIEPQKCFGCGICAVECPVKAISLEHFNNDLILTECEAFL